jgi:hypothetical protein
MSAAAKYFVVSSSFSTNRENVLAYFSWEKNTLHPHRDIEGSRALVALAAQSQ